ncbi:25195_t:CDS:1, partial [Gigaspora rosea]
EESFIVEKKDKKKAKTIIREQPDINIILETLNISDYEEEVAEIEPENDDEKTIMDYSAPDIENEDEVFENIDNLDNSF